MSMSTEGVEAPPPFAAHPEAPSSAPYGQPSLEAPPHETAGVPIEQAPTAPHAHTGAALAPRPPSVTAEQFVREAMGIIDAARPMPLSTSVMINRDEVMTLLESALAAVPDETRQARWLLRERDEVLAKARVDANLVIDEARSRVAQMVQRTEVVRTAERRARQLLEDAQLQTRRRRHEVDEYCERQLAQFANAVDQVQIAVQAARRKLGKRVASPVTPSSPSMPPAAEGAAANGAGVPGPSASALDTHPVVFDQDQM